MKLPALEALLSGYAACPICVGTRLDTARESYRADFRIFCLDCGSNKRISEFWLHNRSDANQREVMAELLRGWEAGTGRTEAGKKGLRAYLVRVNPPAVVELDNAEYADRMRSKRGEEPASHPKPNMTFELNDGEFLRGYMKVKP